MVSQQVLASANNIIIPQQRYRHCNASHAIQIVLLALENQITAKLATNLHRLQHPRHVLAQMDITFRLPTHLNAQSVQITALLAIILQQHAQLANQTRP